MDSLLATLREPHSYLWTFGRYQGLTGASLASGIRSSLDWIGLADRANDKTDKLSGGMKRRLNIAAGTIPAKHYGRCVRIPWDWLYAQAVER